MLFRILGPLEVESEGQSLSLAGPKQRALLATLLLNANQIVSRERLIDTLWGAHAPDAASHRLEEHVSRLRKVLRQAGGKPLVTRPGGYGVQLDEHELDAALFDELTRRGEQALRGGDPMLASELWREGLGLWRGSPLEDIPDDGRFTPGLRALEERRLVLHERLVEAELARGRHAEILPQLQALVEQEPFHEGFRLLLMLALYRSDRQAEALAVYQETRRLLNEEIGIEPGSPLKELERTILRQEASLDPVRANGGPLRQQPASTGKPPPHPATSLVGRSQEIEDVLGLIRAGARLVTLTGPAGAGKTRLALEAARRAAAEFPSGVFWVALASVRDPSVVMTTITQALGASGDLAAAVGDAQQLLVIDNFEQVIEAAGDLGPLVEECPNLVVLVTSRERLRISAETEYKVSPLSDPEAVELFCVRARSQADETVGELCRRLDNLPLAIEFAAARARVLSPSEIIQRISQRLDLLQGPLDAGSHQSTLRSTIEWSHELLSEEEQQLFARLAVFEGGCTLEAAEEVAGADLRTLQSLVEKSLVQHDDQRFSMLETTREFAAERFARLPEASGLARRHALYFAGLAERAAPELPRPDSRPWYASLAAELDNLRASLSFAYEVEDGTLLLRLVGALAPGFWQESPYLDEALLWIGRALAMGNHPIAARGRALRGATVIAAYAGNEPAMRTYAEQSVEFGRAHQDSKSTCLGLANLALLAGNDQPHVSRRLCAEAIAIARAAGDGESVALVKLNEGGLALYRSSFEQALLFSEEAAQTAAVAGNANYQTLALLNAASAARELGQLDTATERLTAALRISSGRSALQTVPQLGGIAALELARGREERAAVLAGAVEQFRSNGIPMEQFERTIQERTLDALHDTLDPACLAARMAEGQALSLDGAVRFALGANSEPALSAV